MFTVALLDNRLPIYVLFLGADHIEKNFLSIVACIPVYKAVAWQRVDTIRYSIFKSQNYFMLLFRVTHTAYKLVDNGAWTAGCQSPP
jgi:hypothetical protein